MFPSGNESDFDEEFRKFLKTEGRDVQNFPEV